MSMKSGSTLRFDPGSWQEAVYDIYIGSIVGAAHNVYFWKKWLVELLLNPVLNLSGLRKEEKLPPRAVDGGELKVIGVGFGRTGTYSLTLALEELGLPTLHTQHLYENEEIFQMWTSKIFLPSLAKGTAELGYPDFDVIASHGYVGTTDFPMALYFDQILDKYPDCKFILTTRENSEVWFRSWDTLTKSITATTNFGAIFITGVRQYSIYLRWLFALVNKDDAFLTSSRPMIEQYKEAAIESYESHNARVRATIPKDQLLEYSVKEGWQPLCDFLEIAECPTHPFPKTNSARSVQVQAVSAAVTPLIAVLFCLFYLFSWVFQRMTGKTVLEWVNFKAAQIPEVLRKVLIGNDKHLQEVYLHKKK